MSGHAYQNFKKLITEETALEPDKNPDHKKKVEWMSEMLEMQDLYEKGQLERANPRGKLYENDLYATPSSVNGMGAPSFPGDPGHMSSFPSQSSGSGDPVPTLLPVAMQIAAQTVGLDIVPVVQANSPWGLLTYLDLVYSGGKIDGTGEQSPLLFQIGVSGGTNGTFNKNQEYSAVNGTTAGSTATVEFLGRSRISGQFVFKVNDIDSDESLSTVLTDGSGSADGTIGGNTVDTVPELVEAVENHITGFSGRDFTSPKPLQRDEAENNMANDMNLQLFSQSVEMESFEVNASVTRKQLQDLQALGVDAVSKVKSGLANEVTQSVNKYILDRAFKLGSTNHFEINDIQGVNFHLNIGATARTLSAMGFDDSDFNGRDDAPTFDTSTLTVDATEGSASSAENHHSRQRRIKTRILAASNMIANRGRRGRGNFVVTNMQVATALQDARGFREAPMTNTIAQDTGSVYNIGSLAGLEIYVDPLMDWSDTRVLVGRKGDGNGPGLVFMPYIMGETVDLIAEGTGGPKILMESRFQLVEAGFHPQTQYLTFGVDSDFGLLA